MHVDDVVFEVFHDDSDVVIVFQQSLRRLLIIEVRAWEYWY